jgi:hypothetical protein
VMENHGCVMGVKLRVIVFMYVLACDVEMIGAKFSPPPTNESSLVSVKEISSSQMSVGLTFI